MEATAQNGGLIGLAGSVRKHASSAASFVSNPDRLAIYLVFFAGVITIGKKAGLEIPEYMTWFGLALGLAALLYEMSASRAMMRAFWEGRAFSMTCNALIWAVAFGFSVKNWVGAASEGQVEKTNLHKAAFNQSADVRNTVKELEEQLDIKKKSVDWSKTLGAPESYEARIQVAKDDAADEETRGGCKSKCIAKRQLAASLEAEKANAMERATVLEEVKALQAKLENARKVAANTKVETSDKRNDLLILTSYAGMSEEAAQIFNGLFSIIVVSIFLSFGSMRDEAEHLRKTGPRQPFGLVGKVYTWFYRLLTGKEPPKTEIHLHGDSADDVRARLNRMAATAARLAPRGAIA